jgi:hypothetical protein
VEITEYESEEVEAYDIEIKFIETVLRQGHIGKYAENTLGDVLSNARKWRHFYQTKHGYLGGDSGGGD